MRPWRFSSNLSLGLIRFSHGAHSYLNPKGLIPAVASPDKAKKSMAVDKSQVDPKVNDESERLFEDEGPTGEADEDA